MKLRFCLDSGAYSIYNKHVARTGPKAKGPVSRDHFRYDYYETREFRKHLEKYAQFCKQYATDLEFYVVMDAIQNAKLTWRLTEQLSEMGVRPLPVVHTLEDDQWVKKYIDHGYTYIGLGGLGQRARAPEYVKWAEPIFRYLGGSYERSGIKVHGFAMTSYRLLNGLPWYSVDSTSPFYKCWMGEAMLPTMSRHNGHARYDYLAPNLIVFTQRRADVQRYFWNLGTSDQRAVREYLEQFSVAFPDTKGRMGDRVTLTPEVLSEDGTKDSRGKRIPGRGYFARYMVNLAFSSSTEAAIKQSRDRELIVYQSGWPGDLPRIGWAPYIQGMRQVGIGAFNYMGTYDPSNRFAFEELHQHFVEQNNGSQKSRDVAVASAAGRGRVKLAAPAGESVRRIQGRPSLRQPR